MRLIRENRRNGSCNGSCGENSASRPGSKITEETSAGCIAKISKAKSEMAKGSLAMKAKMQSSAESWLYLKAHHQLAYDWRKLASAETANLGESGWLAESM
jgi:hypothetical protein